MFLPAKEIYTDYYQVIRRPIDLSLIRNKIARIRVIIPPSFILFFIAFLIIVESTNSIEILL